MNNLEDLLGGNYDPPEDGNAIAYYIDFVEDTRNKKVVVSVQRKTNAQKTTNNLATSLAEHTSSRYEFGSLKEAAEALQKIVEGIVKDLSTTELSTVDTTEAVN